MNERSEAERIIKDINSTECKIAQVLNLILRYNINELKMDKKSAIENANEFMKSCYGGYNQSRWNSYINNVISNASNKPLRNLNAIPVTQKEIDDINTIENINVQKLAFACLVIAKMNIVLYNHSWVSISDKDLFKLANLDYHEEYMNKLIHKLYKLGFISFSNRVDNTSIKYEKINSESDKSAFNITYLSDLGYWWQHINGEKFNICEECGRLYKPASPNQRYCFIHSSVYNKPLACTCVDCGREFQIEPGKRKRKRCECCYMERRLSQIRNNVRNFKNKKKVIN